ncbi:hypothetical protein BH09PSE5_BH09PSE5_25200 [soil metagenome]
MSQLSKAFRSLQATVRAVPEGSLTLAVKMVLVAVACYAAGRIGSSLPSTTAPVSTAISPLWVASGVALAALVHGGRWMTPAIWVGLFFAFSAGRTGAGGTVIALLLSIAGAVGCSLAALPLRRLGFHTALDRRRDLLRLTAAGAVGMAVPATAAALVQLLVQLSPQTFAAGVAGLAAPAGALAPLTHLAPLAPLGPLAPPPTSTYAIWSMLGVTWLHAWLCSLLGALVVGVPLLTVSRLTVGRPFSGWLWLPTTLLFVATVASGWLAFMTTPDIGPASTLTPWMFLPHVLLCWLSARSGISVASLAALVVSATAAYATAAGEGPFFSAGAAQAVPLLWGYASSLAAITLLVSALVGELAANHERWQLALDGSNIGVCDWEPDTGRMIYSRRWLTMLGYTELEFGQGCEAWLSHVHDEDVPKVLDAIARLRAPGTPALRLEYRMRCKDGYFKWVESHALVADYSPVGHPLRIVCAMADMTERRIASERQRLASGMFQHLHEGLLLIDAEHRVLDVNPAFSQITGYEREEMLGAVPALLRPRTRDAAAMEQQAQMWAGLEESGSWRGEVIDRRRNGDPCALHLTISAVPGSDGQAPYHVLVISDVTQARLQREQLERHSHTDELTLLPNRLRLAQMLDEALLSSKREGHMVTVAYVDLDHFKPVNDAYGHPAGDRLLVEVASRLRISLRGGDSVARLGGDEFVLLLRSVSMQESQFAVQRLLDLIRQPYSVGIGKQTVHLTASVGATIFPLDSADAGTLLRHADHAMYGAKQAGRNAYLFFDTEHNRRTEERFEALSRVQEALTNEEFRLYYQPKVDMRKGTVYGVEALLRWDHPELGILAPAHFLPLIEHTGLSELVGDWVLSQGITQLAQWRHMGLDISVSVNVSARHLQEPQFAKRLAELLSAHPPALAHSLELEVLETAALADVEFTSALMEQCRTLGVRFALDDFGTGYSNLSYLKRLPVDVLKIDRSFVHSMLDDPQDMAIVQGVMGLSRSFGCMVVAEGVESVEQARYLLLAGCEIAQGAGISVPMPAGEVFEWTRRYRGAPFEELLAAPETS